MLSEEDPSELLLLNPTLTLEPFDVHNPNAYEFNKAVSVNIQLDSNGDAEQVAPLCLSIHLFNI